MADFSYEVTKSFGILSTSHSGWNREVNMVSWNKARPKLDIRDWAPDHSKMGKGISLNHEEVAVLLEILGEQNLDEVFGD